MNFLTRLKAGLSKTSDKISNGITAIFTTKKLDAAALEQLEELLIESDIGVKTAGRLVAELSAQKFGKDVTDAEVKDALATSIAAQLAPRAVPLALGGAQKPFVILMVGVNGNGKTTTIGKLAAKWKAEGKSVMLAAGDTFRAAAVEQLAVWAGRACVPLIQGEPNADPASVAYQALQRASAESADVLLIDTAGRLQNKQNLMQELQKTIKVLQKLEPSAPHAVVQVLDATTGQNAISQVEIFKELIGVTGLIITKLDGTARGGIVVALAERFGLPIHAVGVGEGVEDLDAFSPEAFARNLVN